MLDTAKLSVYSHYIERGLPMFTSQMLSMMGGVKIHDTYSCVCHPVSCICVLIRGQQLANDNGFTGGAYWGTRR